MPKISLQALLEYWLPPVLWMAVILFFSGDTLTFTRTTMMIAWLLGLFGVNLAVPDLYFINHVTRKLVHVITYFVLSLLVLRAVRGSAGETGGWKARWMWTALAITLITACADEFRQSFYPGRTGSVADIGYDGAGAVLAQWLWWRCQRARGVNSNISAASAASPEEK